MSINISSHNQKGGITANKVTTENVNKKNSFLNNPWLVTIVGGVITGIILLIISFFING